MLASHKREGDDMHSGIRACLAALFALAFPSAALAQTPVPGATVTVNVEGVRSAGGRVTATLCSEAPTVYCSTYITRSPAAAGKVQLSFTGVAPGRYALSSVHDENGNGRPEIPPEGLGLGNNAFAPMFDATAIVVKGNATYSIQMNYPGSINSGSKGIAPPKGTVRIDMRENGLYGEFYAPERPKNSTTRFPAVIVLEGSAPGLHDISYLASQFASNGVAALALAYWGEQGLPSTLEGIPLEYFDTALAALKARPEVDGDRIGVLGVSRGAEAAFMLAARNPSIRAVVAAGPSGVLWQGYNPKAPGQGGPAWTLAGQPQAFLSPDISLYDPKAMPLMYTAALAKAGDTSPAIIPVERINGPILMMSGQEDQIWPSAQMAQLIEGRLLKNSFKHDVETIVYGGLSHSILGASPTAIPRALEFFRRTLTK